MNWESLVHQPFYSKFLAAEQCSSQFVFREYLEITMTVLTVQQPTPSRESIFVPTRTAETLTQRDLLDLAQGRILALRIPNYYPHWLCQELCQRLLQLPEFSRYLRAQNVGVQRTGMTFFETKGDPTLLDRYYQEAKRLSATIRSTCFPYLCPVDKLRVELEEAWSAGARLENLHGRPMLVGIVRMFEDSFELPPHQDVLARDLTDGPGVSLLFSQLSANIYLQEAQVGGELEIWGIKPSYEEFQQLSSDDLHFDREKLPPPAVLYRPRRGDLVLFDSGRVHAVRPSQQGPRVSMSCFIGYRGRERPLTYWS